MFSKRLKIFVIIITLPLLVYVGRLVQMQVVSRKYYQERIDELKRGRSQQLKTIRGRILDRKSEILAADEPQFQLCINYKLCSFLDKRVKHNITKEEKSEKIEEIKQIIQKCAQFKSVDPNEIEAEITQINNSIWMQRQFQAWQTSFPDSKILRETSDRTSIPQSKAMADFAEKVPDPNRRQLLANKVDIIEMHQDWPLVDLQNDEDVFAAQLAFLGVDGVPIIPRAVRVYPHESAAAQTIGWVSKPQKQDIKLFENKSLASYLEDDISGQNGTEYVAESWLRGSRGKLVYDIDRKLVSRTPTRFGRDLSISIDIELQKQIEQLLLDPAQNPRYYNTPVAVVLIDVESADILALVSTPVYNLNQARDDYGELLKDTNNPMLNRTINEHYPPGSVIKPIILLIGLEEGKISPGATISCTGHKAPKYWPNCWFKPGHDSLWQNIARNAIKGSCNIYFSQLANRIDSDVFRQWLLKFGYGSRYDLHPPFDEKNDINIKPRRFKQVPGTISSEKLKDKISPSAKRMFGIGQGDLRVTPLQVANGMATIARGGLQIPPRLFLPDPNAPDAERKWTDLNLSPQNIAVVHEGMYAVVNERGGTAYGAFEHSGFKEQGVTAYGKTGSTEGIELAWFAGFAKDDSGHCIAMSLVVEGGLHGSTDAAPLARDILQFCIKLGYIGNPVPSIEQ
jgi:penicillin-binding protein 2